MNETTPFACTIGLDWADQKHDLWLCPAGSSKSEHLRLDQTPEALHEWVAKLRVRFDNQPVAIGIETSRGPVISGLLAYDFISLFPVNPNGPDPTSKLQAQQYNPDGSIGPVKCGACHITDRDGVPAILNDEMLKPYPASVYPTRYERAVAYAHSARDPGDMQRAKPKS